MVKKIIIKYCISSSGVFIGLSSLSVLAGWHGWTVLPALMLILFSVLQLALTLALCILCEWPPSGQILPLFSFFLFCVSPAPPPSSTSSSVFCPHVFLPPHWISAGYCVAVQGAEMLPAPGLRSNLTAGTCWELGNFHCLESWVRCMLTIFLFFFLRLWLDSLKTFLQEMGSV